MSDKGIQFANWISKASEFRGAQIEKQRIIALLEELKTQMLAAQQPGHKDLTGNMAIRAKGVEIAIDTIKGNK